MEATTEVPREEVLPGARLEKMAKHLWGCLWLLEGSLAGCLERGVPEWEVRDRAAEMIPKVRRVVESAKAHDSMDGGMLTGVAHEALAVVVGIWSTSALIAGDDGDQSFPSPVGLLMQDLHRTLGSNCDRAKIVWQTIEASNTMALGARVRAQEATP